MKKYVDKAAVMAEINKRIKGLKDCHADTVAGYAGEISGLERLLSFLDTLEVKEVDLQHEVESYWKQCDMTWCRDAYSMTHIRSMLSDIAKHFFELGLKAQKRE